MTQQIKIVKQASISFGYITGAPGFRFFVVVVGMLLDVREFIDRARLQIDNGTYTSIDHIKDTSAVKVFTNYNHESGCMPELLATLSNDMATTVREIDTEHYPKTI